MTYQVIGSKEVKCSGLNYPDVRLRLDILQQDDGTGSNATANESYLRGRLRLYRRGSGGQSTYNGGADCAANARGDIDDDGSLETLFSSSSISYDFRGSSGMGDIGDFQTLWQGDFTVDHSPNGTKTFAYAGTWNSPPGDILGDVSLSGSVALATLVQVPAVPAALAAVRDSDTQVTLSWTDASASNGQPTSIEVRRRVNGGAWSTIASISPTLSVAIAATANQKLEYAVRAVNSAGASDWSATSTPVYTSPSAPTDVAAAKDAALDIIVSWTPHVDFSEHQHVVEHSVDGGSTWSALATVSAGTSTYTHSAPNPAQTHRYRVQAKNTSGALMSAWVQSATVQLLAAPNKPTLPDLADYASKDAAFTIPWTHNTVDTTPQTAYEVSRSTNGGTTWTSTGKVTSTDTDYDIAAGTYTANTVVTVRVRTWGQATSGGSDGTGASPWSDTQAITFKSAPVVAITSPADGSTWTEATLVVTLGFSQAQGATFVQAAVTLSDGVSDLETVVSGSLAGITFDTLVENGTTYTITATVLDSNGVSSVPVDADFDVAYTLPVAAGVTITYLPDSGVAQIDLTIAAPGGGEAEAVAVTITRTIDGARENVVVAYPISDDELTILDTTPTINGVNEYLVRTLSADGAITDVAEDLVTNETRWAFLSSGAGYADIVAFFGDLEFTAEPGRESAVFAGAGRTTDIALFGDRETLVVSGSATIVIGTGSPPADVEAFIRTATLTCYRDPSGRRIFGRVTGKVAYPNSNISPFEYEVTEAS